MSVAKKLELLLLSQGIEVIMTRSDDEALTLDGQTGKSGRPACPRQDCTGQSGCPFDQHPHESVWHCKIQWKSGLLFGQQPGFKAFGRGHPAANPSGTPAGEHASNQAGGRGDLSAGAGAAAGRFWWSAWLLSNPEELEKLQEEFVSASAGTGHCKRAAKLL